MPAYTAAVKRLLMLVKKLVILPSRGLAQERWPTRQNCPMESSARVPDRIGLKQKNIGYIGGILTSSQGYVPACPRRSKAVAADG